LGFEPSAHAAAVDFSRDIAAILTAHCAECHGPNFQKGKVSLAQRDHLLGEVAPWKKVVVPGKPDESKLVKMVTGDEPEMPKKGPKLTVAEISLLRQWIAEGAVWPQGYVLKEKVNGASPLWSLQPLRHSPIPTISNLQPSGARQTAEGSPKGEAGGPNQSPISNPPVSNPIDRFLDAKLAQSHLTPALRADPRTLIRRMTFDLLGLPPTPEEVTAFEAAFIQNPVSSIQHLASRLLASPHYGERWARHWLDIAHYADTHGFERDQKRENAWPYRDWVIRAFNDDLPYDRFIRAQIAGDVIAPEDRDGVIATGFLTAGPWDFVGQMETPSPVLKRQARADDLDDMVTQVVTSTLGLTINCARCHNHKLDPIPQEDYYRLIACFAGVRRGERDLDPPDAPGVTRQRTELAAYATELEEKIARLTGEAVKLADIVGGGGGRGKTKPGYGFDPNTGKGAAFRQGFIENAEPNVFHTVIGKEGEDQYPFIDGTVIPDGASPVPITSTGITVTDVPRTSGQAWDSIRNGPVKDQANTKLGVVDYTSEGHSLIGLHANAAINFDLRPAHERLGDGPLRFSTTVGYGGAKANTRADFHVYVDGKLVARRLKFGREDGGIAVDLVLGKDARFLTLMSTTVSATIRCSSAIRSSFAPTRGGSSRRSSAASSSPGSSTSISLASV
jgi:cytochrome c553